MIKKYDKVAIIICHLFAFGCLAFYLFYFTFGIDKPLISGETKTFSVDIKNLDYHIQLRKWVILSFIFSLIGCLITLWRYKNGLRQTGLIWIVILFEILLLIFAIIIYFASQMFII